MNTLVRRTTVATIGAALVFGAVSGTADAAGARKPPVATTTIKCEAATSNKENLDRYDGKSASYMYDRKFRPGPDLRYSELVQFTPQGLTYGKDWDGEADLLLATAYDHGTRDAIIVGLDPKHDDKTATVGVVQLGANHAGGVGLHGGWRVVWGGPATHRARQGDSGSRKLYAGLFNDKRRDWMYRYSIAGDGSLSLNRKADGHGLKWEIPGGTQGVTVAGDHLLFSSPHGPGKRSNVL